jgi:hypothetical protein
MSSRIRFRDQEYLVSPSNGADPYEQYGTKSYFSDRTSDPLKGPSGKRIYHEYTSCEHFELINPYSGKVSFTDSSPEYSGYGDAFLASVEFGRMRDDLNSQLVFSLDFQDDNDFELITFLADLDSTIALFVSNLVKDLTNFKALKKRFSFGAVQWGVLPFISDLKSLYGTLDALINGKIEKELSALNNGKVISRRMDVFSESSVGSRFIGKAVIRGRVTLDGGFPSWEDFLLIMLDELGFHPDLRTAWDIIPLSFVVDYVLPVGDFLESIHPRGWYKPTFTVVDGGVSFKGELECRIQGAEAPLDGSHKYRTFVRQARDVSVPTRQSTTPDWKTELTFKESINLAYLNNTMSRRR